MVKLNCINRREIPVLCIAFGIALVVALLLYRVLTPSEKVFTLTLTPMERTSYKVGEELEAMAMLENCGKFSYTLVYEHKLILMMLQKDGWSAEYMAATEMDSMTLEAGERVRTAAITTPNGIVRVGQHAERYVFVEPGTYTLQVSACFEIDKLRAREYRYSLDPITITVTE